MDAVELLLEHIDVERLLNHYDFDKQTPRGHYVRACCKIHGGNNPTSFVINTETSYWFCHTQCGGGDAYTLVQRMEGIDFPSAVRWVAKFFDIDIQNMQIVERKEAHIKEMKAWIKAMKARQKKELVEYSVDEEIKNVNKFRGFQAETLKHFGLGWVKEITLISLEDRPYKLMNRLVFPVLKDGIQVGVAFRRVNNNDMPKWSNQPRDLNYSEILYNYDNVSGETEIVVCEGITDVWAYYEIGVPAVATFGAHLTEEQYRLLIKTGADIVLSYDNDDAGKLATEKAIELLRYKANLKRIVLQPGQDPENISREELKSYYEQRAII